MNHRNNPTASASHGSLSEIETSLKQFTDRANSRVKGVEDNLLQTNIASATLPDMGRDQAKTVNTILSAYLSTLAKMCKEGTIADVTKALIDMGTVIANTVPEILSERAVGAPVTPDELIRVKSMGRSKHWGKTTASCLSSADSTWL